MHYMVAYVTCIFVIPLTVLTVVNGLVIREVRRLPVFLYII
jgi:hypothetical protein